MDIDKLPTVDRLTAAVDVLSWLGQQASALPDDRENGVLMHLHLTLASSYVLQYAKHLVDGMEPYDALLATAKGDSPLTQRQRDIWNALRPPDLPRA